MVHQFESTEKAMVASDDAKKPVEESKPESTIMAQVESKIDSEKKLLDVDAKEKDSK